MEMLLDLAMTFWQWTVLGVLVVIGYIVNKCDKEVEDLIQFSYPEMPKMQPVPIATKDKGFFKGILMWLMGSRKFLSPVGVLLMGGLVHDYGYKYATLMKKDGTTIGYHDQKHMDGLFRDICIEVNGFKVLNYLAYWTLRLAGFVAWNGHKKRGTQHEVS
jgi:hypothetical protein